VPFIKDIIMKEHNINKLDNFISGYYGNNISYCNELIEIFKNSDEKEDGIVGTSGVVDRFIKDSVDLILTQEIFHEYLEKLLIPAKNEYIKKYPYCNEYNPWIVKEFANIQYYKPGAGYHVWHTERSGMQIPCSSRHLVFMTYLNDVTDAGETEWLHQKIKIKPEKGLTIIWPVDWTFTHRGIVSPTQEKYIVTGWFSFLK
jgi:hypothetical protein